MFRRGGSTNEGIMTGLEDRSAHADGNMVGINSLVRPSYGEGDRVGFAEGTGLFNFAPSDVENIKRLPSGEIDYDYYEEENLKVPTTWGEKILPPLGKSMDLMFTGGQSIFPFYGEEEKQKSEFERERRAEELQEKRKRGVFGQDPEKYSTISEETENGDSIVDTTKEVVIGDNTRESDVKAIYEDILPLLQSTMGVDDSELSRQKYLELAKFGANLMAQPGGSLTRAIGKAAADPLAGLTRIAETKRKSKKAPAEIAMKIALSETESGPVGKQIRDLKKVYPQQKGETTTEWNKRIGDKVTDRGTDTSESRIQKDSVILGDMLKSGWAGAKAARAIEATGLDSSYFKIWPKNEKDAVDGQHYIKKDGTLWLSDGKNMLEWKPKKQKFE